jgi:hypothetical protein
MGIAVHRAVVLFVEDKPQLIENSFWLYESWKYIADYDTSTDLVFMGPRSALEKLPDEVIKIEEQPIAADPKWRDYHYVNSVACLCGEAAAFLNDYDAVLRSDVDVFLTPAWAHYRPPAFATGTGGYSNDDCVRDNIRRIAQKFGLVHHGITNVGSTLYGSPPLVRDICALATELTLYIRTVEFGDTDGAWPSWYSGVSLLYATEIAVNHLVPQFLSPSSMLDFHSTSTESVWERPHIHCWHTDERFSKFQCYAGSYDSIPEETLNVGIIRDYCLAMALRGRRKLNSAKVGG